MIYISNLVESNGISGDFINMGLLQYLVFRLNLAILLVSADITGLFAVLKSLITPTNRN